MPTCCTWVRLTVLEFCLLTVLSPPVLPTMADEVTGTWDLTVELAQATAHPEVYFKQDGNTLTGTYKGRMGTAPLQGIIEGSKIRFALKLSFQDQTVEVRYSGTVDQDRIQGTVNFGDLGSGTWSAVRRKS